MKNKKIKISALLIGILIVSLIFRDVYFLNYVINKDGLVEIFGGEESFYSNDSTIKDYSCIKLNGSNYQQGIWVYYGENFNAEIPKFWLEKNLINFNIKNDTLYIDIEKELPFELKRRPLTMYFTIPDISYVSTSNGAIHVHGFNSDTIYTESINWGMVWLDEDTISYLSAYGKDRSQFGIFEKSIVEHANFEFKDKSSLMSRGTLYKSVNKICGPDVTLKISGRGSEFF